MILPVLAEWNYYLLILDFYLFLFTYIKRLALHPSKNADISIYCELVYMFHTDCSVKYQINTLKKSISRQSWTSVESFLDVFNVRM